MPYIFNGQLVQRPQSVSRVDDSALIGAGLGGAITVAVVGTADGGTPNTPLEFFSASEARQTLVGGLLPDAIDLACAPNGAAGALRVIAVRLDGDPAIPANRAKQATLALLSGPGATAINLTAADWGAVGNTTAVTIGAGSVDGQKITISWRGTDIVGDNLGQPAITAQYTGSGAACTVTVDATGVVFTVSALPADSRTFLFAQYATVQSVVDALNGSGKYTATVSGLNPELATRDLDVVAAVDCKTVAVTLRADLAAQMTFFNSLNGEIVIATKGASGAKAQNLVKTPLAGGSDPVITTASWGAGLEAISLEDVQIVVPLTGDAAIHAATRTHCDTLSGILQKKERRAIVGGVAGETLAQAKGRALALNSDRVQLVWPGLKYALGGQTALAVRPPFMVAAQKAGLSAGLRPGTSATYQYLAAAGVELLLTPTQLDQGNAAAICLIEYVPRLGYRLVQDKTTWLRDQRLSRIEFATAMALDSISNRSRAVGDSLIGRPATPALANEITANLASALRQMQLEGVIVGDTANPAFKDMQVILHADKVEIRVTVSVSVPANYFGITIFPQIYTGAV